MEMAQVKDIMTDKVITVTPELPVLQAAELIAKHRFNGIPVADQAGTLVGILTEYTLITFVVGNEGNLSEKMQKFASLTVADVMDKKPLTLKFDDTFETALQLFNDHHGVNPVPVIDAQNKLVGVVSRFDLMKLLKLYGHN